MTIEFPTKTRYIRENQAKIRVPWMPLTIRGLRGDVKKEVVLDTGSDHCAFPLSLAKQLGIKSLGALPKIVVAGATGARITSYCAQADFVVQDPKAIRRQFEWRAEILLVDRLPATVYGLLGVVGFFEFFDFDLNRDRFLITQNDSYKGSIRDFPE